MQKSEAIAIMREHFKRHPKAHTSDVFKFIYQSVFGCEHMIASKESATEYILREYQELNTKRCASVEPLSGEYSRIDLAYLRRGLSHQTLGEIFYASSKTKKGSSEELRELLDEARKLCKEGIFSFTQHKLENDITSWRDAGYPPVHHSDDYRKAYSPSYRVIANRYVKLLALFIGMDTVLKNNDGYGICTLSMVSPEIKKVLDEIYGDKIKI